MRTKKALMIALFGPDGCGKSTIADLLAKHFEGDGVKIFRMHWRPGFLPYRCKVGHSRCEKDFTKPDMTKSRRGLRAWLVFLYVVMDFLLGHFFLTRPKLRSGIIVLYERYYYDILMDQKRYGLCIPTSVRRTVARLLPVPDTIVLLDAPAEILFARKGELSCVEIEMQRKRLKEYFHRFDNCLTVDVQRNNAEDVVNIILASIHNKSCLKLK